MPKNKSQIPERAHFAGREREIARFLAVLHEPRSATPRVVVLMGPSGIGKTYLQKELQTTFCKAAPSDSWQKLRSLPEAEMVSVYREKSGQEAFDALPAARVDFNESPILPSSQLAVLRRLRAGLQSFGLVFPRLDTAMLYYGYRAGDTLEEPQLRLTGGWFDVLQQIVSAVQLVQLPSTIMQQAVRIAEGHPRVQEWLRRRRGGDWLERIHRMDVEDLLRVLPAAFAQDVEEAAAATGTSAGAALFFDSYETLLERPASAVLRTTGAEPEWLVDSILEHLRNVLVVIATSTEPSWAKAAGTLKCGFPVVRLELGRLSNSQSEAYLYARGVGDPRHRRMIASLTRGHPQTLAIAADVALGSADASSAYPKRGDLDRTDVTEAIVGQLVRRMTDTDSTLLCSLGLVDWVDEGIFYALSEALRVPASRALWSQFKGLSLLSRTGGAADRYIMHRSLREVLTRYLENRDADACRGGIIEHIRCRLSNASFQDSLVLEAELVRQTHLLKGPQASHDELVAFCDELRDTGRGHEADAMLSWLASWSAAGPLINASLLCERSLVLYTDSRYTAAAATATEAAALVAAPITHSAGNEVQRFALAARAHKRLAEALHYLGEPGKAAEAAREAAAVCADGILALGPNADLLREQALACADRAESLVALGRMREAADCCREALQSTRGVLPLTREDEADLFDTQAMILTQEAEAQVELMGDLGAASATCREAIGVAETAVRLSGGKHKVFQHHRVDALLTACEAKSALRDWEGVERLTRLARSVCRDVLETIEERDADWHRSLGIAFRYESMAGERLGDTASALANAQKAVVQCEEAVRLSQGREAISWRELGLSLSSTARLLSEVGHVGGTELQDRGIACLETSLRLTRWKDHCAWDAYGEALVSRALSATGAPDAATALADLRRAFLSFCESLQLTRGMSRGAIEGAGKLLETCSRSARACQDRAALLGLLAVELRTVRVLRQAYAWRR